MGLQAGQVVAGRYLLESPIGEGAMGTVFRAVDQTLKRPVAIKFLFVKGTRDPQAMVDQFLREARIAASVQHRNVIQTVDFGTVDDQPFMVMELLNGESLGERMDREPKLTREQLIHIVSLTLRGLAAVHDAGIVPRDLKPQNIFLQRDADAVYPKILDFGISRSLQHGGERPSAIATQEGLIVGTPDYMSPEQARGEANIDQRADIYSMAVILYEGLTGRLPFEAETIGDLIVQIMTAEPPRAQAVDPSVPQPLSDMIAQAMSKKREHRFSDARAMRRALLGAAESALPPSRRAGASIPPPTLAQMAEPLAVLPNSAPIPEARAPVPAQVPGGGGATWGDFEGLNAARIIDQSLPPPARQKPAEPESPKQQRIVVEAPAPAASPAEALGGSFDRAPPVEQASTARTVASSGRKSTPKATASTKVSGEDALDPLYAGSANAALDIDYDRAGPGARKQPPGRPSQARAQRGAGPGRARTAQPKVRYKRSYGPWILPIVALLMLGYFVWKPSPRSLAGAAETGRSRISQELSSSSVGNLHLSPKARREKPGEAPPHMRDVVF
ncbi:MAG: protein kinase [Polyangiales bacterium]